MLAEYVGLALMLGLSLVLIGGRLAAALAESRLGRAAARAPARAQPAGEIDLAQPVLREDPAQRQRQLADFYRAALLCIVFALEAVLLALWAAVVVSLPGSGLGVFLVGALPLAVGGVYLWRTDRLRW